MTRIAMLNPRPSSSITRFTMTRARMKATNTLVCQLGGLRTLRQFVTAAMIVQREGYDKTSKRSRRRVGTWRCCGLESESCATEDGARIPLSKMAKVVFHDCEPARHETDRASYRPRDVAAAVVQAPCTLNTVDTGVEVEVEAEARAQVPTGETTHAVAHSLLEVQVSATVGKDIDIRAQALFGREPGAEAEARPGAGRTCIQSRLTQTMTRHRSSKH